MYEAFSVRRFGAVGDGIADDTAALQAALSAGGTVYLPTGLYRVTSTLKVPSDTHIHAEPTARVFLCGSTRKKRGDFLLTNAHHDTGDVNIRITGGVWDGNHDGAGNSKADIYDENGYSGTALNFFHVQNLTLQKMVVANTVAYNIRMSCVSDFLIEDIDFLSDTFGMNQDGLHFGGDVRRGQVRRIRALSNGQTNDDLLALNADDYVTRVENRDLTCGDIEDIVFEDVFAENCHTIIRFLSVTSRIRNITFRNIWGGYRCNAINADAGRYMRTPLFTDAEKPQGVGRLENICIDGFYCYSSADSRHMFRHRERQSAIVLETHAQGLQIRNFRKSSRFPEETPTAALFARNLHGTTLTVDGVPHTLAEGSDTLCVDSFTSLDVTRDE